MADLNALIAQGAQFKAPVDPFVQYGQMQQLEQGQAANQLNRMKMDEYQRGLQEQNALRGLDPTSPDYESQLFKVNPTMGIAYRKEASAAAASKATQERQNVEAAAVRQGMLGQAYRDISSRPSDANITAHMEDVQTSPLFKPDEIARVKQLGQTLLSMPFDQRGAFLASQGAKSSELKPPAPPASIAEFERAQKDPKFMKFLQERAAATRAPATPATPSAPVAVIGPNGEEIFVSREEALSKRMTPASGARLKPIPTQINQAIIKNVQTLRQLDDTIALLEKNPDATGYKGYLPNVVLSRVDPEGVDVRAGIADIGSLVLHERSGAAVTAAESPRLLPFIPLATDDNATAVKKLKRMREIAAADQLGLTETYGQDQGYKPNPLVSKPAAAPEAAPAIPTIYATNGKQRLQSIDGGKNWTPVK